MDNKDKPTPMNAEQVILKEKRAFELDLKKLTDDKESLLAEIVAAEQELKTIDTKIHTSEQLIDQLDAVTEKTTYFSDADQLKSIQVKDAQNLADTFKVLGREAQTKKKELWSQINSWHTAQSKKKDQIGQIIDGYKKNIADLEEEINTKKQNFEAYVLNSSGDKAGKKRAKNVLDAANKNKKVLNSFNAPISIIITSPSKEVQKIPFIFSFKKEGDTWKYVGTTNPVYNKKMIQSVSMKFSKNELMINKDFKLEWSIKFTSFEETLSKSKNDSTTTGKDTTKSKDRTKSILDKSETTVEGEAEFDILVVEATTKGGHTWGSEELDSTTKGKSETIKKAESESNGTVKSSTGKAEITSCEGKINYSSAYLENGEVSLKASGDHKKQQIINDKKYTIQIDDRQFVAQFN